MKRKDIEKLMFFYNKMPKLRVKYSSFKYIASLNLFFLKMIVKMLWQIKLLCLFFLVQVVSAQQVPSESNCADTFGLAYDLNIISKKQTLKRWQRRIAQNRRMYKPINLHFSTTIVN